MYDRQGSRDLMQTIEGTVQASGDEFYDSLTQETWPLAPHALIEPGELYADGQGIVYVGITEHEARAVTGACPGAVTTCAWALRRVKVVDA